MNPATLNVLVAAKAIAGDVDLLVAGEDCSSVVQKGYCDGVRKVLHVEGQQYAHVLAENLAPLIVSQSADYEHLMAAATTTGKNVMPRGLLYWM